MNDAGLIVRMDGRDEAGSVVDADIGRHGNLRPVNNEVEMLMDVERVSFGRERGKMNRLQTGKKIFDFRYPGRRSRLNSRKLVRVGIILRGPALGNKCL